MEAYLRLGMDMLTAIRKVDEDCGLVEKGPAAQQPGGPTVADNNAALASLEAQLRGMR